MNAKHKIPIGISMCLLGKPVRYDGGHKRNTTITKTLAKFFEFIPLCPEVEIGLGVPREPIQLVGNKNNPEAIGKYDANLNVTIALRTYAKRKSKTLTDVYGYIFKSKSPSCGLKNVNIFHPTTGAVRAKGSGIFAQAFIVAQPLVPCIEETELEHTATLAAFTQQVFIYYQWRLLRKSRISLSKLQQFHEQHSLRIEAHSPSGYTKLQKLLITKETPITELAQIYINRLMQLLAQVPTRGPHITTLPTNRGKGIL